MKRALTIAIALLCAMLFIRPELWSSLFGILVGAVVITIYVLGHVLFSVGIAMTLLMLCGGQKG